MFTGLVKSQGKISKLTPNSEGMLIEVTCPDIIHEIAVDDSVSINGACQTVISYSDKTFVVQAVHSTLQKTNFSKMKINEVVNLELAMRLSDRFGGHFVQGHVNTTGQVVNIQNLGLNYLLDVEIVDKFKKYLVPEGSITINGVSLTINKVLGKQFTLSIIPHTWMNTNLENLKLGDLVNVEFDVLLKYMESLIKKDQSEKRLMNFLNGNY